MADQQTLTAQALTAAEATYSSTNPTSATLYAKALDHLPGGNTRTPLFFPPFPLYLASAHGSKVVSVDGNTYTDLLGDFSAGIYGHSEPVLVAELTAAVKDGSSFGGQHAGEVNMAAEVGRRFPSMERVRFTNSGTEAALMAVVSAKGFTGRSKVVAMMGGYHGAGFTFKEGMNDINVPHDYVLCTYNDVAALEGIFGEHGKDIAAVIMEPMIGSGGCIPGTIEFITAARSLSKKHGSLLIFDEVMTSRMHSGYGIQGHIKIFPDMTIIGKYFGGGLAFGCFGGRADIMAQFDPRSGKSLPHAGTFNNNVLTMRVGLKGLTEVFTEERAKDLHTKGDSLRDRLNGVLAGTKLKVSGYGSIMAFHVTQVEDILTVRTPSDFGKGDGAVLALLHLFLLEKGYYIARKGFMSLSLALSQADLDGFVSAVTDFVKCHANVIKKE